MWRRTLLQGMATGVGGLALTQEATAQANPGTEKWRFETLGSVTSSPTVINGTVYIGAGDTNLYAVDATNGTEQWQFSTTSSVSSPVVADGTVYVGSYSSLYAVNATDGTEQWRFESEDRGGIEASPTVVDGTVYVGSHGDNYDDGYGNLYAVNATDGTEQWRFDTVGDALSSPTIVEETVYIGSGANLYAVNATDGTQRWRFNTGSRVVSSPTVADGTVYVGGGDENLYAVDATDGTEQWRFDTVGRVSSSPTVAEGMVYIGSSTSLHAVDATDGTEQLRFNAGGRSSPTVADGTVYVGSDDGNLYAVDTVNGEEQWRFETDRVIYSSPTVANGTVYVGSYDQYLYAVSIDSNASSEGSRALLGTLGHTDQFNHSAPATNATFTSTPSSTPTPEPTATSTLISTPTSTSMTGNSGNDDDFIWILLGLLGVGGSGAYYLLSHDFSQQNDDAIISSVNKNTQSPNSASNDAGTDTESNGAQTQNKSLSAHELWDSYHSLSERDPEYPQHSPAVVENHLDQVQQLLPGDVDDQTQAEKREELLEEFVRMWDELEEPPSTVRMNLHGEFNTSEYQETFDVEWDDLPELCRTEGIGERFINKNTNIDEDTEVDIIEAQNHLNEAQRLAGPTVEYLLTQGRRLATDARDNEQKDNIDTAVSLWEDTRSQYEEARERAAELNDSRDAEIAETCMTVTERLTEARQRQTETDLRQAVTSAWSALTTGDEYAADGSPKSRAKAEYTVAAGEYRTADDYFQKIPTNTDVADTDSIETAITIAQDARNDCESIDVLHCTRSEFAKFSDNKKTASLSKLTAILDELDTLSHNNKFLHKQVLTAVLYLNQEEIHTELQQAWTHINKKEYQKATSALDNAEMQINTAADKVQKAPGSISNKLQSTVDVMEEQLSTYRAAITEALADIDTDPTLEPVSEITLTPPTISDLPSESDVSQVIPACSTLWEKVAPKLQPEYNALQSLLTTVDESTFARWISIEYAERIASHQTALDQIEPITASEDIPSRREGIFTDCRAIISALNQRVVTDIATLEDANFPDGFHEPPQDIAQIDTESRLETNDVEQFTQEWSKNIDRLVETLNSFDTAVSVIEAYDEIAEMVDQKLATDGVVSPEELPVDFAEQVLRIYAHRQSHVTFDSDQSLLCEIS